MRGKILLVVGLGVGYVLGARAGRGRYDEIVGKVQGFWNDPRVQKQVSNAGDFVKDKAPGVADFVTNTTKKAAPVVRSAATAAKKPATGSSTGSSSTGSTTAKS